jgi:hypothetical protein
MRYFSNRKIMKISRYWGLLLLISMPAFAQPPFSGTVFIDPDVLTAQDPSTFVQVVAAGVGSRQMFDRRANSGAGDWIIVDALLFNAFYTDGEAIEIQLNPEFDVADAEVKANFYGHAIGQLPSLLRIDVQTVWIHKGDKAFGGGNNNILIHTDAAGYHGEWLEETIYHEACHTSLDSRLANSPQWLNAQSLDGEFISTYARDNPTREDVAESCLLHFALRNNPDRISTKNLALIESTIANRLAVLDAMVIKAIVESDRYSSFDPSGQLLHLPAVKVGDAYYELTLKLADPVGLRFTLVSAVETMATSYPLLTQFSEDVLNIPLLLAAGKRYKIKLALMGLDPVKFQLTSASELE